MMSSRRLSAVTLALAVSLGACGSDDSSSDVSSSDVQSTSADDRVESTSEAADEAQPDEPSSDADCAAVGDALTRIFINWQVVIGLVNSPASEWASIPIGTVADLGAQLDVVRPAVSEDRAAADAVAFMSGANDIVVRGYGGDAAAQADLAAYLGDDVTANLLKQQDISLAYANLGCA